MQRRRLPAGKYTTFIKNIDQVPAFINADEPDAFADEISMVTYLSATVAPTRNSSSEVINL